MAEQSWRHLTTMAEDQSLDASLWRQWLRWLLLNQAFQIMTMIWLGILIYPLKYVDYLYNVQIYQIISNIWWLMMYDNNED